MTPPPVHTEDGFDQADLDFEFDYLDEIKAVIAYEIASHERSVQTAIGPSDMGTACHRKFAYKLAGVPPIGERDGPEDQWRQTVGTAVHEWLARTFAKANERELTAMHQPHTKRCPAWCAVAADDPEAINAAHTPRFGIELTVAVGTIDGEKVYGHVDIHDRKMFTVDDWKIVGPKSLKDKHAHGPGSQNEKQGHIYAGGLVAAGHRIDRVVLIYLPMNGELRDAFIWSSAYKPELRKKAFARARDFTAAIAEEGIEVLAPRLGTAADYCHRCPYFAPGEPVTGEHCPGDKSLSLDQGRESDFEGLV